MARPGGGLGPGPGGQGRPGAPHRPCLVRIFLNESRRTARTDGGSALASHGGSGRPASELDLPLLMPTRSGLRVRLPGSGDFAAALGALQRALEQGAGVRGLAVTVEAGARALSVPELREIEELLLERLGAALIQVVEGQPEEPGGVDGVGGRRPGRRRSEAVLPLGGDALRASSPRRTNRRAPDRSGTGAAEAATSGGASRGAGTVPAGVVVDTAPTLLVRRTLRSGQRVRFHGNVVVLGDVNPGAEIVASGDIVVMGTLRGVAHAGATGSGEAVVAAFRLQPMQLRVGAVIGRAPDGQAPRPDVPEVARLRDGSLVIERYVPQGGD